VAYSDKHTGPVQAVDFNPFQANLLVSGAGDSEIHIWDVNKLASPMTLLLLLLCSAVLLQGEVRTQVVKWNSACPSVHGVMSEMLLAAELSVVSKEHFRKLTGRLYSQLCCFPSASSTGSPATRTTGTRPRPDGGREGGPGGWRAGEDRVTPFHVLEAADENKTDGERLQFFANRSNMIVRRMKVELVRGGLAVPGPEAGQGWAGTPRTG
jgi:hypothetical protein